VDKNVQQRQEYLDEIREQYVEMREEFYAGLQDRKYLALAAAQKKKLAVDWADAANAPVTPKVLGSKVYLEFPIEDVIDYIDWNPFFQVRCAAPGCAAPGWAGRAAGAGLLGPCMAPQACRAGDRRWLG
jgi:cobalamin-dependent methionine synthase I